jgi:hypothetical protein
MPQLVKKIEKQILKNATLLKQCDLMMSARASLVASESKKVVVKALHRSGQEGSKAVRCKHYGEMPYHPLPNASMYKIANGSVN